MAGQHEPDTIGERLHRLRGEHGLTQEALAALAGLSVDLVKKLEQGKRQSARLTTIAALANALDVPMSELTDKRPRLDGAGETRPLVGQLGHRHIQGVGQGGDRGQPRTLPLALFELLDQINAQPGQGGKGLLGETMFAAQSVESFTDRVGFVLTSHGPSPSQEERSWRRAGPNANPAARRRPRRYANGRAGRLSLSAWPRRAARPWWVPAREPTRRCRAAT